jgi:cell division protein FtsW
MDLWLAAAAFALTIFGLVMVYSASSPTALKKFADPSHYAVRNVIFALIGLAATAAISRLSVHTIRKLCVPAFWITMLLLLLVLVPGVGIEGGGARRWINFGVFTIQPSEPFKIMLILYVAHLLAQDPSRVVRWKSGLVPILGTFAVATILMMSEPDFGSTMISGTVLMGLIFIAGVPLVWIAMLLMFAIPAVAAAILVAPYRFQRVVSFWDPWDDPLNSDFQLVQSLLSFGNGGIFGLGLGQGQQKQFYLPESHTDFIFAVVGEELGLFWVLVVIALFAVVTWRAFLIARRSEEPFVMLGASGLAMLLGTQSLANMGVVMGLLPPKGLTLPLVSYGGSSLVITMAAIGCLLAFSRSLPPSRAMVIAHEDINGEERE